MKFFVCSCFGLAISLVLVTLQLLGCFHVPVWILWIPALFFPIGTGIVILMIVIIDKLLDW